MWASLGADVGECCVAATETMLPFEPRMAAAKTSTPYPVGHPSDPTQSGEQAHLYPACTAAATFEFRQLTAGPDWIYDRARRRFSGLYSTRLSAETMIASAAASASAAALAARWARYHPAPKGRVPLSGTRLP